jgi:hypothetical protein
LQGLRGAALLGSSRRWQQQQRWRQQLAEEEMEEEEEEEEQQPRLAHLLGLGEATPLGAPAAAQLTELRDYGRSGSSIADAALAATDQLCIRDYI